MIRAKMIRIAFQNRFERPKAALAATQNRIAYARSALYACPYVKLPIVAPSRSGVIAATAGILALVAATGYGVYKFLAARPSPESEPIFPPVPPEPTVYR